MDRALDILEVLAAGDSTVRLNDIARAVGLNVSTCHHLVSTLVARGYASQAGPNRGYRLGNRALDLGEARIDQVDFLGTAICEMRRLNKRTRARVHFAILQDFDLVNLAQIDAAGREVFHLESETWKHAVHATAKGKAILAWLPREEIELLVDRRGLQRFTPNTVASFELLNEHLRRVREDGFALDREEFKLGVTCAGAPLRDRDGAVIGAISCSVPSLRAEPAYFKELCAALSESISSLYRRLHPVLAAAPARRQPCQRQNTDSA